jgi:hypothetical protein
VPPAKVLDLPNAIRAIFLAVENWIVTFILRAATWTLVPLSMVVRPDASRCDVGLCQHYLFHLSRCKLPPSARWNLEYGSEAITIGHSRTSFSRVSAQKSLADCTARVWCRASYSLTSAPGSGGVHPGAASWRHLIINPHLLSMSWLLKSRDILKPDVFIHPATSSGR